MKKLVGYFLQGLLFLAPVAVTVYVIAWIFTAVDGWLHIPIPGLGFLATLALIVTLGFLVSNFLTQRIFAAFERALNRLPLIKLLHSSIKDLLGAFVGEKKRFDKPVLLELSPDSGVRVLGFITRESLAPLHLPQDLVAVYLPQAYNFAGQLVIVPRARITAIAAESSEVMAFIVSGGIVGKEHPA